MMTDVVEVEQGGHNTHESAHTEHPSHFDNWFSLSFGEGKAHQNPPFGFVLVNFSILIFILVKFGRKPLADKLANRRKQAELELTEASEVNKVAKQRLAELEVKLARLDEEVAAIQRSAREEGERIKTTIVNSARLEAEAILRNAQRTVDDEFTRASERVYNDTVQAAMVAAEKLIRQSITDADRQRVNDEYLNQLGALGGAN